MSNTCPVLVVVPALSMNGGIREALRLAHDVQAAGHPVRVLSLWRSPQAAQTLQTLCPGPLSVEELSPWRPRAWLAPVQLPLLAWRFWRRQTQAEAASAPLVFTHYATWPLALAVARRRRWFFVQDLEWRFLASGALSAALKVFMTAMLRRGQVLSANAYLTGALGGLGLTVHSERPVWADPGFATEPSHAVRDIDLVMVLRRGAHKRPDLSLALIAQVAARWRLAVITPDDDLACSVAAQVTICLLRPDQQAMRALYARSRCFVHLSEHEGFGLPPLEAMGAGCVPLCRDSGGVRCYLDGPLAEQLVVPLDWPLPRIEERLATLLANPAALQALGQRCQQVFAEGVATHAQGRAASITDVCRA